MRTTRTWIVTACSILALAVPASADAETEIEDGSNSCFPVTKGRPILIRLSQRPETRVTLSLDADDGRAVEVTWDPAVTADLARTVTLHGTSKWRPTPSGERTAVPTPDGKGQVYLQYGNDIVVESELTDTKTTTTVSGPSANKKDTTTTTTASSSKTKQLPLGCQGKSWQARLELRFLSIGPTSAEWKPVPGATPLVITITEAGAGGPAVTRATSDTAIGVELGAAPRGLDAAVPAAVGEVLSLLAEIAVDRARAEGARLFKGKLVKYLCDQLTVEALTGAKHETGRLLPSTCGQLENLRITDLGASGAGLAEALREDISTVVVPVLFEQLLARGVFRAQLAWIRTKLIRAQLDALDQVRGVLIAASGDPTIRPIVAALGPVEEKYRRELARVDAILADPSQLFVAGTADVGLHIGKLKQLRRDLGDLARAVEELREKLRGVARTPGFAAELARRSLAELPLLASTLEPDALRWLQMVPEASDLAKALLRLVRRSMKDGLRGDDVRLVVIELRQLLARAATGKVWSRVAARWGEAFDVALSCASQGCSVADLVIALGEDAETARIAQRLVAVLQPAAGTPPPQQASELVVIMLELAAGRCTDQACTGTVNALQDIALGLLGADYLRALGGINAVLKLAGVTLKGKPMELAAAVISYVRTHRETAEKDPKTAHELRKKALEGIIDAATDRSGRPGDTIVSLGASVGFALGGNWALGDVRLAGAETALRERSLRDLRIPLGVSVQGQAGEQGNRAGFGWFVHASIADLAHFVGGPVLEGTERVTRWSDFVSPGLQVGLRFFNDRVPLVIGVDTSWLPRVTVRDVDDPAAAAQTTSVFQLGVFAGFNVPFFDLN